MGNCAISDKTIANFVKNKRKQNRCNENLQMKESNKLQQTKKQLAYQQILVKLKYLREIIQFEKKECNLLQNKHITLIITPSCKENFQYLNSFKKNLSREKEKIDNNYLKQVKSRISQIQCYSSSQNSKHVICEISKILERNDFEIDILNSYIQQQIMMTAKSFKLILMLSPELFWKNYKSKKDLKELIIQIDRVFRDFSEFEHSIILVFNQIQQGIENNLINQRKEVLEQMIDEVEVSSQQKIIQIIIDKIYEGKYLFFYEGQNKNSKEHLKYIRQVKGLKIMEQDSIVIKQLNNSSKQQLQDLVNKCEEGFQQSFFEFDYKCSLEIISQLFHLAGMLKQPIIQEGYDKTIQFILEYELIFESLQVTFSLFLSNKKYDYEQVLIIISIIRKVLNCYFLVELIKTQIKVTINFKYTLDDVITYLYSKLKDSFNISIQSNDAEFKLSLFQKIKLIVENQQIQNDIDNFNQHMIKRQQVYTLQADNLVHALIAHIKTFYQSESKELQYLIGNQLISDQISKMMDNISSIDQYYSQNDQIQLDCSLNYINFQQQLMSSLQNYKNVLASQLYQKEQGGLKIYQEKVLDISLLQKYTFYQFICSQNNTGNHFQDEQIQLLMKEITELIEQAILLGINQVQYFQSNSLQFRLHFIDPLLNLDSTISQRIRLKKEYKKYIIDLKTYFQCQFEEFNKSHQKSHYQIKDTLSTNESTVSSEVIKLIENNTKQIQELKSLIRSFTEISQEIEQLKAISIEYETTFIEYENTLFQVTQLNQEYCHGFKLIQILIYYYYIQSNYHQSLPLEERLYYKRKQLSFMQNLFIIIWENSLYLNQLNSNEISFLNPQIINKTILEIKQSKQFYSLFSDMLLDKLKSIFSHLEEDESIDILQQKQQINNQKSNLKFQLNYNEIQQKIIGELERVDAILNQYKENIVFKFKNIYSYDFSSTEELETKSFPEQKIYLDNLLIWFDEQNEEMIELFGKNIYFEHQQQIILNRQRQFDKINEGIYHLALKPLENFKFHKHYEIEQSKFKQGWNLLASHFPQNISINTECQEMILKIAAQQFVAGVLDLIKNNKLKESAAQFEFANEQQQEYFVTALKESISVIIGRIKLIVNNIQYNESLENSREQVKQHILFSEASHFFRQYISIEFVSFAKANLVYLSQILIDHLFKCRQIEEKIVIVKESIYSLLYAVKLEGDERNHFEQYFIQKMIQIYQDIQYQIKELSLEKIQEKVEILIQINSVSIDLQLSRLINSQLILNEIQVTESIFNQMAESMTQTYVFSLQNPDDIQILEFIKLNFSKFWELCKTNQDQITNKIICNLNEQIRNIQTVFSKGNLKSIYEISLQHSFPTFIEDSLLNTLNIIDYQNTLQDFPQDNFTQITKYISLIKQIQNIYGNVNSTSPILKIAYKIGRNIEALVIDVCDYIKQINLNSIDNYYLLIKNLNRAILLIDSQLIDSDKEEINKHRILQILNNSLIFKFQQLKDSISTLNPQSTLKHIKDLNNLRKEVLIYQNKSINFLQIYKALIKDLKSQSVTVLPFKRPTEQLKKLDSLLGSYFKSTQVELIDQCHKLYESNEFSQIIQNQQKYQSFCILTSTEYKFVSTNTQQIFIDIIEQYYKHHYKIAIKLKKNQQKNNDQTFQLNDRINSIKNIEDHFSNYSKYILKQKYFHKLTIKV